MMNRSIEKKIWMRGLRTGAVLCFAMLLAAFGTLVAPKAMAQAVAVAEVTGYVTDPTGRPVAGAQVTMTETEKNLKHTTTTDAQGGGYSFPNLDVGTYNLTVSSPGFKQYVQSHITLQVASNIGINVQLVIGVVTETVEVRSDSTMIETKDNSIAQVIDSRRMVDLPLNGRNPTQLLLLSGAATAAPGGGDLISSKNIGGSNGSGTFSIAGGQANGVNYLLDGGDNNDPLFNVNLPLPFPDALQEFSVQTSSLPAQYGLHPGGVVNAVTKSGSNAFHGDVFEFLRNGAMDAIQDGTLSRDSLKRSQFGGVIGGRIIRDKLFFFAGYQGTRQRSSPPNQKSYVATAANLKGDFSSLLVGPTPKQLHNPVTKAPFANNQIPVSMFNATAVNLLTNYLPISAAPGGLVQYGFLANNPDDQVIGRLDYTLNQKHSMYARYYIYDFTAQTVFDGKNLLTTANPGEVERSQTFTFGDSYIFTPKLLNSFHATFARRRDDRGVAANAIGPTTLGINMYAPIPNYLQLSVSNYFATGCRTCAPGYFNANTYQVSDDIISIHGKHELAFGGDFRRLQGNMATNGNTNGGFTFNGSYTGDALADTFLGDMSQFVQANPQPDALRQSVFSFYAQDTFHAAKGLTLNFGLRWEPAEFPYDKFGRTPQFSQAAFNAGTVSTVYPGAPAGLIYPGDAGSYQGKSQVKSYWLDVSPRVGLIYDPRGDGKQSIRAGFGLMHDTGMMYFPQGWTGSPPFASTVTLNNPVGDDFTNPWAGQAGGNPFPGAAKFPIAGTYYIVPTDMKPTYEMQWNVNIQQKLASDWMAQVGYLGTRSIHIWSQYDINPSVYIAGSSLPANSRRLLYLQNKAVGQYYGAIYSGDPSGHGQYDALLASLQHGFAKHFQLTANYTWSHCISNADLNSELNGTARENPYSLSFERGNCSIDVTSVFNLSGVASIPDLHGGFAQMLLRNWQLSPIFTWHSGSVLNITDGSTIPGQGVDLSGTAQLNDRPNQILANPYPVTKTTGQWFNPLAFAPQAAGTFGNVHRNSLRGPGAFDFDASVSRVFHLEKVGLMFRVDAFNALNHPIWFTPYTNVNSGSLFGTITSFGAPRILQVGAKVMF